MRRLLLAGLFLSASAARADLPCTLARPVKQSVKGEWTPLPSGASVVVTSRGPEWSTVESPAGSGRVSTPVLLRACPAIAGMPVEGDTAAPAPTAPAPAAEPIAAAAPAAAPPAAEPAPAPPPPSGIEDPPSPAAVVAFAPPPVLPPADRLVAVLDLKAGAGLESMADALATMTVAEIAARDGYRAVSRNELKSLLTHRADAALLGCESVRCISDAGKLVDAQLVVAGSIDRVGNAHVLSLSLVDPSGPTIVERTEASWRGAPDGMLPLIRPLVGRLLAGPNAAAQVGGIDVLTDDGARVIIDGREVGIAPLPAPIAGLPTGVHRLQVEKDGAVPHDGEVVVAQNENTIARISLEEVPFTQKPWFWLAAVGTGLLAAGATTGIVVWAVVSQEQPTRAVLAPKP